MAAVQHADADKVGSSGLTKVPLNTYQIPSKSRTAAFGGALWNVCINNLHDLAATVAVESLAADAMPMEEPGVVAKAAVDKLPTKATRGEQSDAAAEAAVQALPSNTTPHKKAAAFAKAAAEALLANASPAETSS